MRILIADDERIARARLRRLVEKLGEEVIGEAATGTEALALSRELHPDVLLLDIDMPGLDGLAVAEQPDVPPVVFTTAHRDHAVEAFDAGAYDYLLKPVSEERLQRALEKVRVRGAAAGGGAWGGAAKDGGGDGAAKGGAAMDAAGDGPAKGGAAMDAAGDGAAKGAEDDGAAAGGGAAAGDVPWRLVVSEGSLRRLVDAREVGCFQADHKYVGFRHGGDDLLLRDSLDALEERLARYGFLRVSRSALVRRDAVTAYDAKDGAVVLQDGARVSVSRRLAPAVRAALGVG